MEAHERLCASMSLAAELEPRPAMPTMQPPAAPAVASVAERWARGEADAWSIMEE